MFVAFNIQQGKFNWGSYSIAQPTGSTTTFLRNDGQWATPSGKGGYPLYGTFLLNQEPGFMGPMNLLQSGSATSDRFSYLRPSGSIAAEVTLAASNGYPIAGPGGMPMFKYKTASKLGGMFADAALAGTHVISFWFAKNGAPAAATSIMDVGSGNESYSGVDGIGVNTSGQLRVQIRIGGSAKPLMSPTTNICDGELHHILINREWDTHRVYIDGVLAASTTGLGGSSAGTGAQNFSFGINGGAMGAAIVYGSSGSMSISAAQALAWYNSR